VPTLNRFPLLGLWAEEAARRAGFKADEAKSLGHAYAVLYAIRAARRPKPAGTMELVRKRLPRHPSGERVRFGGDELEIVRDSNGHVRGQVGGDRLQTPATYHSSVEVKFPANYYQRLQKVFRLVLKRYPPRSVREDVVYDVYDEWKNACGVGRLVDVDALLRWCRDKHQTAALPTKRSH
jgi:hypothetical protein